MQALLTLPEVPELLISIVARWQAKYPEAAGRISAGRLLVEQGAVTSAGPNAYDVTGTIEPWYRVTVTHGYPACECAYFLKNHQRCKHIWACALIARLVALLDEATPEPQPEPTKTPTPRKRPLAYQMEKHCRRLHQRNAELDRSFPLAEVVPIQRK